MKKKRNPVVKFQVLTEAMVEDYFIRQPDTRIWSSLEIGECLQKLYRQLSKIDKEITNGIVNRLVSDARAYMELKYKKTLVTVRPRGLGWKVGTPQEATRSAFMGYTRYLKAGQRVLRRIPLVDARYIAQEKVSVFKRHTQLLEDFARKGEPLLLIENGGKR